MRYLRVVAVVGVVAAVFIGIVAIYMNHGPLREAPLAWAFAAAGALLTIFQALRNNLRPQESVTSRPKYLVPHTLPPSPAVVGRKHDLDTIMTRVAARTGGPGVIVVHGDPGVGKTALAIDAARRLASSYPDGALFAWLGGRATTESVLRIFVSALQAPDEVVPTDRAALRERYALLTKRKRRRLLIVLDDAPNEAIVESLLPDSDESAVIVTSRTDMPIAHAASALRVEPLASQDAIRVFAGLVGQQRIEREPKAAERIVASAQGSPLAINVAGTSLAARPNWTLEATLDSVNQQQQPEGQTDSPLDTSLDLSFSLLTEEERQALLWLGQLDDRTFEPWELATMMDLSQERVAWRVCDRLVHHRLLEHVVNDATGIANYRVLEHVMEYVRSRAGALQLDSDELADRRQRLRELRMDRGRRDLSLLMKSDVYPELEHGNLSSARNNIRGALAQARMNLARAAAAMRDAGLLETGGRQAPEIHRYRQARDAEGLALAALAEVHAELGKLDQAMEMAQAARRTKAPVAQPRALRCIGSVQRRQRRLGEAHDTLHNALQAAKELKLRSEQVRILREMALLFAELGQIADAWKAIDHAMTVQLSTESRERIATSLLWARAVILLSHYTIDQDPEHAREAASVLAEASKSLGKRQHLWTAWIGYRRAQAFRYLGRHEQARSIAVRAAGDFAGMRHRYGVALCRFEQVRSHLDQGQVARALPIMEDARQSLSYCEDRHVEAQAVLTLAQMYLATGRVTERTGEELGAAAQTLLELGDDTGWRQAMILLTETREAMQRKRPRGQLPAEMPTTGGFWTPSASVTGGS